MTPDIVVGGGVSADDKGRWCWLASMSEINIGVLMFASNDDGSLLETNPA